MMNKFKPRCTYQDVLRELARGFADGSVSLELEKERQLAFDETLESSRKVGKQSQLAPQEGLKEDGDNELGSDKSASRLKILVLGGDGFCGWPTALYRSRQGHDIVIVDNLSRRKIDIDLEVDSLAPIASMSDRLEAWKEVSGNNIKFEAFDVVLDVFFPFHPIFLSCLEALTIAIPATLVLSD